MSRNAKTKTSRNKAASSRDLSRRVVIPLLAALVMAMICAGVSFVVYNTLITAENEKLLNSRSRELAAEQATKVRRYVDDMQRQMHEFVDRPLLYSLAITGQEHLGQLVVRDAKEAFPAFHYIKLISIDPLQRVDRIDASSGTPTYIELNLVNNIERQRPIMPEIVAGDAGRSLLFGGPVTRPKEVDEPAAAAPQEQETDRQEPDSRLVGTLLLGVSTAELEKLLASGDAAMGETKVLSEPMRGSPIQIVRRGQGDAGQTSKAYVKNSRWAVEFTPSAVLADSLKVDAMPIVASAGGISLFLVLLTFLLTRKLMPRPPQEMFDDDFEWGQLGGSAGTGLDDIFDLDIADADQALLGLEEASGAKGKRQ